MLLLAEDLLRSAKFQDLSVESLALHAAMSRRNFTRVFTAELGTSPAQYIEQLRIEAARRFLEDSQKSVEEIASVSGFSSAELMRRAFLRLMGITPSEYRERFRSAGNIPVQSPVKFTLPVRPLERPLSGVTIGE